MRSKRRILALGFTLIVMAAMAGCKTKDENSQNDSLPSQESGQAQNTSTENGTSGQKEQVVTYNVKTELSDLDPGLATGLDQSEIIKALFEGLVNLGNDGTIKPGQAEKWEISEDGKTYTFTLRDGLKWSDGQPLTAHDFEYSMIRLADPKTVSKKADEMYKIENGEEFNKGTATQEQVGVKALDDKTLQVTFKVASANNMLTFLGQNFVPVRQDMVENNPDWFRSADTYVSNGPFLFIEWKPREQYVVAKNENYWNAEAIHLDKIIYKIIPDDNAALAAFRNGEIDILTSIPTNELPGLKASKNVMSFPTSGTYWYTLNFDKDYVGEEVYEIFSNRDFRAALAYAVDRKLLTEKVLAKGDIPNSGIVPGVVVDSEGKSWRDYPDYVPIEGDVEKAKELLAKAGYTNGEGLPVFEFLYNSDLVTENTVIAIQDMWKQIGVQLSLVKQETQVFAENRANGKFQITRGGISAEPDPYAFMNCWMKGAGFNFGKYDNQEFEEYMEAANTERDGKKRDELLRKAEDALMNDFAVIPLYAYVKNIVFQPNVKGIRTDTSGALLFDEMYVE